MSPILGVAALVTLLPLARAGASALQDRSALESVLADHRCATLVTATLDTWGARTGQARSPAGADDLTFAMPTTRLGTWVVVQLERDGAGRAMRIDANGRSTRAWSAACETSENTVETPERVAAGDAFTDEALAEKLSRLRTGVIYLWSPHMPLSVSGYRSIAEATRRLGIALVIVLDPHADMAFAAETVRIEGLPPDALAPLTSVELTFRDLATHAPSIQPFLDGTLLDGMLPGYRDAEHYVHYLRGRLDPH